MDDTIIRRNPTEQELRENPSWTPDTDVVIRHPRDFELAANPGWQPSMFLKVAYVPKRDVSLAGQPGAVITGRRESAQDRALSLANEKIKANPQLTISTAQDEVFKEHPELHELYRKEAIGDPPQEVQSAEAQVLSLAAAKVKTDPRLSMADAQGEVFGEHPELGVLYRRQQRPANLTT
jgi:hypothetical protein